MKYRDLVAHFKDIEATTKRLEMTQHLVALLGDVPTKSLDKVVYMMQGALRPDFEGVELGMAEKSVVKAVAEVTGHTEKEVTALWKREGDLGSAAAKAIESKRQRTLHAEALTVDRVYDRLTAIARATGEGSQEQKRNLLAELVASATPDEVVYILRTVTGRLRLGVADMTLLDALAAYHTGKKAVSVTELEPAEREAREALRRKLEAAYNVTSDLGLVARTMMEREAKGLEKLRLAVFTPVRPMLAERARTVEEILERMEGTAGLEYKYDGLRVQAHITEKRVELFSRRLERITGQFPDLVESLRRAFQGSEAIVEGEAVAVNPETGEVRPFQEIAHRRGRKYGLEPGKGKEAEASFLEEYPVAIFLFDLLLLDGADHTHDAYEKRRRLLENAFQAGERVRLAEMKLASKPKEVEAFFEMVVSQGGEGVLAKRLDSSYRAGSREWSWIKFKRDYRSELVDTLDLAAVGAFWGRGKRGGTYGALLMATYNDKDGVWESVTKLGTGFTDEVLASLPARFKKWLSRERPKKVVSALEPDVWFVPSLVMEVVGAEITLSPLHRCAWGEVRSEAGLAVRFPRFTGTWRDDKKPEQSTTSRELVSMYNKQLRKVAAASAE